MPALASRASGAFITTLCCRTVPSAKTAAEPKARITVIAVSLCGGPVLSSLRPDRGRRVDVLDHASAPASREEAERPADQHEQPVLEPDQVPEVHHEPGDPCRESAQPRNVDVRHGPRPADRREVALIAIAERLGILTAQTGLDELGGVAALLHRNRC